MNKSDNVQKILNKYCPTCGQKLTIGKKTKLLCVRCAKSKKATKK